MRRPLGGAGSQNWWSFITIANVLAGVAEWLTLMSLSDPAGHDDDHRQAAEGVLGPFEKYFESST